MTDNNKARQGMLEGEKQDSIISSVERLKQRGGKTSFPN